jgi:5-amino-6-(5-phosphoribosylamino)uracil reductase
MTAPLNERPHVVLSAAISIDGCSADASGRRLILSSPEDFDAVDALRAECDAILVGAGTIRGDNPRLVIRSETRRQERRSKVMPPDPVKVTLTESGQLDAGLDFFRMGGAEKIVYCSRVATPVLRSRLGTLATVIAVETPARPEFILADLHARGIRKLLVEGGSAVRTLFLSAGVVDEIRLAIAPFFVGEERAPRFVSSARFPHSKNRRMTIKSVEQFGDMIVIWYLLRPGSN